MAQARYDAVAEFYIQGFDSIDDPASRALLDLLGPVTGLRVLDVARGHGRITRELARRGASVLGVDLSGALITRALAFSITSRVSGRLPAARRGSASRGGSAVNGSEIEY